MEEENSQRIKIKYETDSIYLLLTEPISKYIQPKR